MDCRAVCGSISGGGLVDMGLEKSLQRAWQLPGCKSASKHAVLPAKKSTLPVRAVSTESSPASLGRRARREQNVEGEFYVDRTCIDCDTCRWMAPTVFTRRGAQSAVHHQPASPDERMKALQALLACPTSSIRTVHPPKDIIEAQSSFPLLVDPEFPGVYHCGYHSEKSFAGASYFITRPGGNILVDSPRFTEQLAKRFDDLGGVRYIFLTHRDDVADHKKWQSRFKCERIIHELEVNADTRDVEIKLTGNGNWNLGSDIDLIFTPGHTEGHVVLLKDKQVLFSGDHLAAGQNSHGAFELHRDYNWYSVSLQIDSFEALIPYDFTWVLPGHGRRVKFESLQEKNDAISKFVAQERRLS